MPFYTRSFLNNRNSFPKALVLVDPRPRHQQTGLELLCSGSYAVLAVMVEEASFGGLSPHPIAKPLCPNTIPLKAEKSTCTLGRTGALRAADLDLEDFLQMHRRCQVLVELQRCQVQEIGASVGQLPVTTRQWFSAFLKLRCFNTAPQVVTTNHNIVFVATS